MIRHMLTSAAGAGLAAGILAAGLHFVFVQDLILTGETYESGAAVHFGGVAAPAAGPDQTGPDQAGKDQAGKDQGDAAAQDHGTQGEAAQDNGPESGGGGLPRDVLTFALYVLLQVAYALLLVAGFALARLFGQAVTARQGLLWGIAGFAAVQMAPSMGLAPELPGAFAADLSARQLWWWGTVVATAGGLALIGYGRGVAMAAAGVALIALPHLIGAPLPEGFRGTAPPELAGAFAARVLGVGLAVWAVLGWVAGRLWAQTN